MRKSRHFRFGLVLVLPLLLAACGNAREGTGLRIMDLGLDRVGGNVVLRPKLSLRLSPPIERALDNGVPVTLVMEARVTRARGWFWPATQADLSRRYTLLYHSLGEQYLVREGKETPHAFPSRLAALTALSDPDPWPLMDTGKLEADGHYRVALRVGVDLQSLPAPLRLMAYFSPAWHVGSGWRSETIEP